MESRRYAAQKKRDSMKTNPLKYAKYKEKKRVKYHKRKKLINEMNKKDQLLQRIKWKEK